MKKNAAIYLAVILIALCSSTYAIEVDEFGTVDIHGFISQGYLQSDENNFFANTKDGSFALKDVGISFSTDVTSRLRIGVQIMAYEMGDFGSDKLHINWANGDYNFEEWLGIKAGKMKLHHGLYNTGRDADFLRTSILLPQSVYNEAWRSTVSGISGFEAYGTIDTRLPGRFSYNAQVGKVDIGLDSGVTMTTKEELLENDIVYEPNDIDHDKAFVGRLNYATPIPGLNINATMWFVDFDMTGTAGVTGLTAYDDIEYKTESETMTASIEYSFGDFIFVSEYSLSKYNFKMDPLDYTTEIDTVIEVDDDLETEGYYASLAYRFTDWFETGVYYSVYYPNKDDKDGATFETDHSAWLKDTCLSVRFDIMDNWVLKFEGHVMNGTAVMMNYNNPVDEKEEDWLLFGTKMTFSF